MNKYTSAAVLALLFANANSLTIKNKLRQTAGSTGDYNPADFAGSAGDGSWGDYDPYTTGMYDGSAGDDGTTWSQVGSGWGETHGTASAMGRHVGDLFDTHFGGSWSALGEHVDEHFGDHIDTLIDPESYEDLGDHLEHLHATHGNGSWGDLGTAIGEHVGSWGAFGELVGDAFDGSVSAAQDHVDTHFAPGTTGERRAKQDEYDPAALGTSDGSSWGDSGSWGDYDPYATGMYDGSSWGDSGSWDDYDPAALDGSAGDDGTTWSQVGSGWGETHGTASAMGRHVGDLFDTHFGGSWSALGDHVDEHFGSHIEEHFGDYLDTDDMGAALENLHATHGNGSWGDLGTAIGDHLGSWGAFGETVGDMFDGSVSAAQDHVDTHFAEGTTASE